MAGAAHKYVFRGESDCFMVLLGTGLRDTFPRVRSLLGAAAPRIFLQYRMSRTNHKGTQNIRMRNERHMHLPSADRGCMQITHIGCFFLLYICIRDSFDVDFDVLYKAHLMRKD